MLLTLCHPGRDRHAKAIAWTMPALGYGHEGHVQASLAACGRLAGAKPPYLDADRHAAVTQMRMQQSGTVEHCTAAELLRKSLCVQFLHDFGKEVPGHSWEYTELAWAMQSLGWKQ